MDAFQKFTISNKKIDYDRLRITAKANKISAAITVYKFRDKDTRQIVFYTPSLELTSYGADEKKQWK